MIVKSNQNTSLNFKHISLFKIAVNQPCFNCFVSARDKKVIEFSTHKCVIAHQGQL